MSRDPLLDKRTKALKNIIKVLDEMEREKPFSDYCDTLKRDRMMKIRSLAENAIKDARKNPNRML